MKGIVWKFRYVLCCGSGRLEEKMDYRIGLDIGIASVGWAVLENDENDEPKRIVDLGVRIFDVAEIPKTGASLAEPRREARTTRRRLRRRRHRLERIRYLLEQQGIITEAELRKYYERKNLPSVYELRVDALERKLKREELAQILIHIAKHRGFKSTRKAETKEKEGGEVLSAVKANQERMKEKGYRTVGEMIYRDEAFREKAPWSDNGYLLTPRNREGKYLHTILRETLIEEVKKIFEVQRELGNVEATELLEQKYIEILKSQRSFDKGPGNQPDGTPSPYAGDLIEKMVGKCTFEPEERRASKAAYTSERFVLLQKVNHLKIVDGDGNVRPLTTEERQVVVKLAYTKKEVKYKDIRKSLFLQEKSVFKDLNYGKESIEKVEGSKFISLVSYHQFKKILSEFHWEKLEEEEIVWLDRIAEILTLYKSDESRDIRLREIPNLEKYIDDLLELNPSKFQHLSIKAMKKIMPYLEQGFLYYEACEQAGYDFKGDRAGEKMMFLKGEVVNQVLEEIPNPVVKRSISQTIKVVNAIIREYGSPQAVHIELAREMSKNFQERKEIEKQIKKNQENNEAVVKQIKEYGVSNPTGLDIIKFRLWKDQNETCIYSGNHIPIGRLFQHGEYDVDHIIPYSISFNDSYSNKVLVEAKYNREKGNRLPYEYFGDKEYYWNKYEILVNNTIKDSKKRQNLLKKKFTEEERQAFKERNLTDTKYITRVVYNLIRNYLCMAPYKNVGKKKKIKQVYAVNGTITAYMRKRWDLGDKSRATDKHHAKDAVVVACCTDGMIQKISRNVQGRELAYAGNFQFIDIETGEIRDRSNFTREEWDAEYGVKIPLPWKWFRKELEMRMADNPMYFFDDLRKMGYPYQEKVEPIFVSRMPNHKVTGAGHADTIRSPRHYKEEGIVLSKTDIKQLKLNKDDEIQDYYNPDSDRLLYEALKRQLQLFGGNAQKAFEKEFHKPKADGSEGPVVKKVKLEKKLTMGVFVNGGTGIAENANGSMIRIDIFRENGKYYFVPIYIPDTLKKELPNRAATAGKSYNEWRVMKEENFLFSLYPRDLIYIKKKNGIKLKKSVLDEKQKEECWAYFTGANISTVSISGISHDRSFEFEGLGIQSLEVFKKYSVDVLGNKFEVKSEKRLRFYN